jgi:hypothetical protein
MLVTSAAIITKNLLPFICELVYHIYRTPHLLHADALQSILMTEAMD